MTGTCNKPDCTVAATGRCLISHPDPLNCPNFSHPDSDVLVLSAEEQEAEVTQSGGDDELSHITDVGRRFHQGIELGADDALEIMRARYAHLIGVLGSTDAGKTCLLSSMYLMASGGNLPNGYQFAGSLTLQAFEDRARGLRQWENGTLPSQLVDHTILAHPRQPSLLHLAILEKCAARKIDLLLTDLPGEWTDNLVLRAANAPSFDFLRRADGIIVVVDGRLLASDQRFIEVQRVSQFAERLSTDIRIDGDVPFVLLISKSDEIAMQVPEGAIELKKCFETLGYSATVISAAAFSRTPEKVSSGTGVFEAIDTLIKHKPIRPKEPIPPLRFTDRSFQKFQS